MDTSMLIAGSNTVYAKVKDGLVGADGVVNEVTSQVTSKDKAL